MNIHSKLESEKQSLVESLHSVEKRLNEEKSRNNKNFSNFLNLFKLNLINVYFNIKIR